MGTREESTQGLEDQEDEEGERQAELHTQKQRRTTARQLLNNSQATVRQMKSWLSLEAAKQEKQKIFSTGILLLHIKLNCWVIKLI